MKPLRLFVPAVADRLHLSPVEHQIGREHGGRPRLIAKKLQLLLNKRIADSDIRQRRSKRRLADERLRMALAVTQLNVQNIARRNDELRVVAQHSAYHVVAAQSKEN